MIEYISRIFVQNNIKHFKNKITPIFNSLNVIKDFTRRNKKINKFYQQQF